MGNFLISYRQESIWDRRGAAAFVLAPLAPVLAYSVVSGENFLGSMMFGAVLAYAHVLLLGLPLAAWVNLRRKISLLNCAFGAAFIAVIPWAVFLGKGVIFGQTPVGATPLVPIILSCGFFGSMGFIAGVSWWFIACYKTGPVTV